MDRFAARNKAGKQLEWIAGRMSKYLVKNLWRGSWKKLLFVALVFVLFTMAMLWDAMIFDWAQGPRDSLFCFDLSGNKLTQLDENEPKLGSGIYFHETSCPKDMSDISLNARQACSAESALRAHPNTDVYLLITSPVFKPLSETNNVLIRQLLTYPGFKVRHINFSKYLSNTPLNVLYTTGALNYSLWPVAHTSDVLRYATLYKFGGIYLDLDVIVLKSMTELKNFAGAESNTSLGSGILGFSDNNIGREVATRCAEELARTYNGRIWGFNGPGVITRVLSEICKTTVISNMFDSYCEGFRIYPAEYFSALSFNEPELFFKEGNTEKVEKILNRSYTIHYWNKMSSKFVLNKSLDIPFLKYARKYCPRVYHAANGNF